MKGEGMDKVREARWYCINRIGMATLCAGEEDARRVADRCNIDWPRCSPHRAVQLVELTAAREALSEQPAEPLGYLPAYELARLRSGHSGNLRSAKFGPSKLDGDVAVYTADQLPAAQQPAPSVPAVPEGMQLVPKDPTPEMILAGHQQIDWCRDGQNTQWPVHSSQVAVLDKQGNDTGLNAGTTCEQDLTDAYRAMLAVAPHPAAKGAES